MVHVDLSSVDPLAPSKHFSLPLVAYSVDDHLGLIVHCSCFPLRLFRDYSGAHDFIEDGGGIGVHGGLAEPVAVAFFIREIQVGLVVDVELTSERQAREVPPLSLLVPVRDEAVEAIKAVSRVLEEETPADSVQAVCFHWETVVVVKPALHSDYVLIGIVREEDVFDLALDEDLGQEWDSSPQDQIVRLVRQVHLVYSLCKCSYSSKS